MGKRNIAGHIIFNKKIISFNVDYYTRDCLISKDIKNRGIIKPVLRGKDIERYLINYGELYLITTENGLDIVNDYLVIYEYLNRFKNKLIKRSDQGSHFTNLRNCAYYDEFLKPKIIWQRVCKNPNFVLDLSIHYMTIDSMVFLTLDDTKLLNLYYLIGILNSKLIYWYLYQIGHQIGKGFLLSNQYVEQLPIKIPNFNEIDLFTVEVKRIQEINENLNNEIKGFLKWLQGEYNIDKLSQKLEKYYELTFDEFLEELRKKKVNTKKRSVRENLEAEFYTSLDIIRPLQQQIQELEDEINQKVYKLYDLTDDEIKIIEDSLND